MQVSDADLLLCLGHNGVVGSGDERDEEGQHHVDEEGDEGVEVDLAEDPHQRATVLHLSERDKHVVPVDQRKQALRHHGQGAKLGMIGPEHNPSTEAISQVNGSCTAAEADNVRESSS